jgi:hypothetical protein
MRSFLDWSFRRARRTHAGILRTGLLLGPENLEARCLLAFSPFTGKDTTDKYMVPATKVADPPNPQWNMEKVRAADTWWLYDGNRQSVVVVEDYGLDFRHEDFGGSGLTQGQFWDYGRIHSSLTNNLRFSRKGRDDFHYPVDIEKEDMPKDWIETIKPDSGQYLGNVGAGIIGAKTDNKFGVAGINWDVQMYSAKVVVNDTTSHDIIAKRANRMVQYLRLGKVDGYQNNPDPQLIRAVSFGYSTEKDFGDIFHEFEPVPDTAPDGAGHYDFVALGSGIKKMTNDDAKQGILVTVPTGDWNKTWPTRYYREGSWDPWKPWVEWDPNYRKANYDPTLGPHYGVGNPDNILAVAATDIYDKPWVGNARNPIDIYAPGVDIWSVGEKESSYVRESGTRQAQAHVAGAIALLYDVAGQHDKEPTYHEVREAIIEGGDDIGLDRPRLNIVNSIKYLSLLLGVDLTRRPEPLRTGVTIQGGAALEGDAASTVATFTVGLTRAINAPLTIGIRVEDGSAQAKDADFVSPSATGIVRVTFPPQSTSRTFTVAVQGDRRVESDETLVARIVTAPGNVTSGVGSLATWTIRNDDSPPTVSLTAGRAFEGSAKQPGRARVFAKLSKPSVLPVTVQYSVVNGSARLGVDYLAPSSNVVTIPANATAVPIDIRIVGDSVPEPDVSFQVRINQVVNGTIDVAGGSTAMVIVNDDDRVLVSLAAATVMAVASGTTTMVFTVKLNRAVTSQEGSVAVGYRTIDGSGASGAVAGVDYLAASGRLVFAPGEISKTFAVTVLPRRTGQRYPKSFTAEISAVSAAGRLEGGLAALTSSGRIS